MAKRHRPVVAGFARMLHGGDYNPEQWIRTPAVWDEDVRLLKLAHCNTVTLGVFSWAMLEPREGQFEFGWLDTIFAKMADNGIRVILATPGGAKPAWLANAYPETLRVTPDRRRNRWGHRHNHCMTSPVYRAKCQAINAKLAERYGKHPALAMWHVNNEYSGECHCNLCQAAFRDWLKRRYDNDLDKLNHAWWANFWSHTITGWDQLESPGPLGEMQVHGQNLDWKRFTTDQTISFFRAEREPLARLTPDVPVTTNFMGGFAGLNYAKLARELDVVSWDSYPTYHDRPGEWEHAVWVSFLHSQRRAMLDKPFVLMESAPAQQNYKPVCKLKRPGVHTLEGLQAIAHGSDSVLYFQWRKSRGGFEKFHGAVVDHSGTEAARVFQDVAELGKILEKLDRVVGTDTEAQVAFVYDYENRWAIDDCAGPRNQNKDYAETCAEHYRPFWQAGVSVDVIDEDAIDLDRYALLIAPMLYMIRPGVAERIERFVERGGTFVCTYFTGVADESDLCFLGGMPGPLRKLMGVWAEETDALYDDERVPVVAAGGNGAGLSGSYEGGFFCDLLHAEGARVLATYGGEFYAGRPAATVNAFAKGHAYYIASRNDRRFQDDFYGTLIDSLRLCRAVDATLPRGVTAQRRTDGTTDFIFLLNFTRDAQTVALPPDEFTDALTGAQLGGARELVLARYAARVLTCPTRSP